MPLGDSGSLAIRQVLHSRSSITASRPGSSECPDLWRPRHGFGAIPLAAARRLSRCRVCPCSSRTVVVLARRGLGFARSHRHLLSLPKAPRFARVRSRPRPPEERPHAGTRLAEGVGSDERRGGGLV